MLLFQVEAERLRNQTFDLAEALYGVNEREEQQQPAHAPVVRLNVGLRRRRLIHRIAVRGSGRAIR